MSTRLRFGLVGTGPWAMLAHGPGLLAADSVDLVGVWGRNPDKAAEVGRELGVADLGIGTHPSCTCQRRITCAGVTPCSSAAATTGPSVNGACRLPSGLQDSVRIPSPLSTSRICTCGK